MTTLIIIAIFLALWYIRANLTIWTISMAVVLIVMSRFSYAENILGLVVGWTLFIILAVLLNFRGLRRSVITKRVLPIFSRMMPTVSRTEQEALDAGTVDFEAELFSGAPNWQKLLATPAPQFSAEEKAFLEGPVEQLCRMIDDWEISHCRADITPEMWQFLKDQGFFGLIIPKQYGGKEFSAYLHSEVLLKLHSRSPTLSPIVAVPNSLGPAELLLHYGTEEQKNYYLPRLAKGEEIPCFALTAPDAGSDAAAMPDHGIVCHGEFNGKAMLGIRLTWNKRYITLAPVATVLGLAFKLYDPEHLLGETEEYGITCALIPTKTSGVIIGRRHFPVNNPFQNGPTQGNDVFIPLDWIIGGAEMAGQGWRMLMECLAAGRAISLPSTALGGMKMGLQTSSAYARIRKQFNVPIGHFEGIAEVLVRMAGYTYLADAARHLAVSGLACGSKSPVAAAIMKYHITELARLAINGAMDIHGGKGICLGPRNYLARNYENTPVGITVEGANILTRNLMIFGQGSIRCHPYILQELAAAKNPDPAQRLRNFDRSFFGHMGFSISNVARALLLGLTSSWLVIPPSSSMRRYYQHFTRFSADFALLADVAMIFLGGNLKRLEKISGRLGDILSWLYFGSAVLKRFHDLGEPDSDAALVKWICRDVLQRIQQTFHEVLRNFPQRWLGLALRVIIFPLGQHYSAPSDRLERPIAEALLTTSVMRNRLIQGIDLGDDGVNQLGLLESALLQIISNDSIEKRVLQADREGRLTGFSFSDKITAAANAGVITADEEQDLRRTEELRQAVIAVDDFSSEELAAEK